MDSALRTLFLPHQKNNQRPHLLHAEGFLILALIILGSRVLTFGLSHPGRNPAVLGFSSSITASQVVVQTNAQRQSLGLTPLTSNAELSAAALAKGNNMCADQYWAHISPSGVTPWVFIKNAGYKYAIAGENLARDFSDTPSMVQAWMNSPTHRENIVNPKYADIGVAVIDCQLLGSETALVVQMFGTEVVNIPTVNAPQKAQPIQITKEVSSASVAGTESVPQLLTNVNPTLTLTKTQPTQSSYLFTPLQVTKAFMVAVLGVLLLVLTTDMILAHQRSTTRLVGRNIAHLLFLSGILFVVLVVKAGAIF